MANLAVNIDTGHGVFHIVKNVGAGRHNPPNRAIHGRRRFGETLLRLYSRRGRAHKPDFQFCQSRSICYAKSVFR